MKKHLLALFVMLSAAFSSQAAPGDTTWVQANLDTLSWYGNYDSTVTFPAAGSYRNIYMIVTIGKYVCPGSPTYCGDWDYTVQNFLMTPGGDTLELGRLITPYANSSAPRTPLAWKHRYVFDVTDYASKLTGSATMRLHYSGYSGGFTGDIKFAFIEGTPDRNVTGLNRLWKGSYGYGGATSINTNFTDVPQTAPAGTQSAEFKFNITGHGSDDLGCCEFLSKNYKVMLNGAATETKAIWRDNCAVNELYPQSGTWLYDRANWCPGALVNSNFHKLPGITSGSSFNIALEYDAYTSPGGGLGSYTTEGHMIYYGGYNKTTDAGIDDIIAPTNNENHFRSNPICGTPTITVKNHGSNSITGMTFEYGVKDSAQQTHTWMGTLNAGESTEISLPALTNLETLAGTTPVSTFVARIVTVNGSADLDPTNDKMTTPFNPSPKWDGQFRIMFKPNNQGAGGISETNWKIYDASNTVVKQRINAAINTLYTDTVTLPTGCYRLEITDGSCDGLHWWVYDSNPGLGVNAGTFFVKKYSSAANINMNGYVYSGTFSNDFGCKFTQYFYTNTPVSVTDITAMAAGMDVYPNPAYNEVNVEIGGMTNVRGTIHIVDIMGRIVKTVACSEMSTRIGTGDMNTGVYTILFVDAAGNKLQSKLVIAK
ncbi:hypothetical protein GCM10023093_22380 [Nemorincola caseinilytica]|uniref:T9SS type A sorting domain-containing protein n=1 Tax=Nemorincola caseinilytica TaxID=2054315 RepID=A0ABP8NGQ4_9BACT